MNSIEFTRFRGLDYACKEAINTLCTNLTFVGENQRVLMFTSVMAHEGKSFLSMNVVRTLGEFGKKVVHVDCDLRRSQIASKYGMRVREGNGYGTVHFLAGMCSANDIVYATNLQNVYVVPVGRAVSNSLALLNSARLPLLLKQLRERFDFVIIDAPPVGVIVDAAEIGKHADGVIFSVNYNNVSRKDLAEAKGQMERSGCTVLGAVLNNVDLDSISSKHYYNKSYYSYYTSDDYRVNENKRAKPNAKATAKK